MFHAPFVGGVGPDCCVAGRRGGRGEGDGLLVRGHVSRLVSEEVPPTGGREGSGLTSVLQVFNPIKITLKSLRSLLKLMRNSSGLSLYALGNTLGLVSLAWGRRMALGSLPCFCVYDLRSNFVIVRVFSLTSNGLVFVQTMSSTWERRWVIVGLCTSLVVEPYCLG